ncbi:Tlg2-vesicle protein [Mortierella sp. AD032]|nr:Tlg2-vesicle protein [Mortierella sp. AD032]
MAATCIFPLLGYGVVSMICGYIYGMPKGFLPAFVGDLVGASICFWLYRLVFYNYISRKFGDNVEFKEMSKAVSKDGLFFFLATTLSTPRLFIAIFIGHNLSSLADPTLKGSDRTLKWGMNIIGVIIALAVGWYIYRHTKRRIERINAGLAPDESEEDETTRLGRQQQQQQQGSFGHESVDHDSFDLEEAKVTLHPDRATLHRHRDTLSQCRVTHILDKVTLTMVKATATLDRVPLHLYKATLIQDTLIL